MKYAINAEGAPKAFGHYSQGTTAGRLVLTSGMIGEDPATGEIVEGGLEAELEQAIDNIEVVLSEIGCALSDVAQVTVYLTDMAGYDTMDRVYARRFPSPEPARSVIQVEALPKKAQVEIECVACR